MQRRLGSAGFSEANPHTFAHYQWSRLRSLAGLEGALDFDEGSRARQPAGGAAFAAAASRGRARGDTALHYAAYNGHAAVVHLLLEHRASPEARDGNGAGPQNGRGASCQTPLDDARRQGHSEVAQILEVAVSRWQRRSLWRCFVGTVAVAPEARRF
eukprot:Skav210108  [mRNA]  locus=scaffold2194:44439:45494:+ [translate_table: standard]